jgi:hypothetical protein
MARISCRRALLPARRAKAMTAACARLPDLRTAVGTGATTQLCRVLDAYPLDLPRRGRADSVGVAQQRELWRAIRILQRLAHPHEEQVVLVP